ncbi:putative NAD(P)-binding protein [Kribbella sp. VKM Ac-2527]|uniref:Putative NAD(P)-binding protein n=1 Tax=Kribbella caucasensis TaxID=2512215 RepID=A0A4R6KU69_9ACTN|nr:NAD(P)H-binding protein [Kribbella sp. VKM Ac-2527]TDO54627.1 putative NAD(P)-binding protein [Kribbella sp. VKM Ac-2527]
MTILVVGGTGELGGRVAGLLHQQGKEVRCLVRPGSDDKRLRALGIEVTRGDLTDPAGLPAACAGITAVVATATVIGRRLAGARRPTIHEVDEVGMTALVSAADQADVERFVGGPEAISRNEAVAIAEQATGRTFKTRHLPRAAARLGMRLLARPNDALASIFGTGLLQDLVESRSDDSALRLRGITPTAASEFIRSQSLG